MRSKPKQIEVLPIDHGNFYEPGGFYVPGVDGVIGTGSTARLGGQSQNNIMMDGISAMDTGNNGQMLNLNIESIGEVKVLTQGYQAEYGRSSGLQITAVTKSGTNSLHGSGYGIFTNSDWNSRSWTTAEERRRYPYSYLNIIRLHDRGAGGNPESVQRTNKLFFFYAHEFQAPVDSRQRRQRHPAASADRSSSGRAISRRPATRTAT